MLTDKIQVRDIRAYGYTGVLAAEQTLGQWFRVDLTLWLDLALAGHSDRLTDTLDYRQAITIVKNLIQEQKFALIERLAEVIATQILELPLIEQVQVELTKLAPPIADFGGQITVSILRPGLHKDELTRPL
jgi:dihydroneopterin aldolase